MSLDRIRKEIDEIDNKLIELIEARMKISHQIGKYKVLNNIPLENKRRENEILQKVNGISYQEKIKDIFKFIFIKSKEVQKYDYFLVGKSLNYSFSPKIYQMFGLDDYNLFETSDFSEALKISFKGINVTNPFKEEAYKTCSKLSDEAKITKVVNTLIKTKDGLYGDNTDYFGILNLINHFNLDIKDKKVIIIGNGATAKTCQMVLNYLRAKEIIHLVRNKRNEDEYLITEYNKFNNYDYIFNATPYGTYPSDEDWPLFPLEEYKNLKAVIDVIYNPLVTPLMHEAYKYNVKAINGLYMLVSQAAKSYQLYTGIDKTSLINDIYINLIKKINNIVLIGMPYTGKTKIGRELSLLIDRKWIDIDKELEKNNEDLNSLIKTKSIEYFRSREEKMTIKYSKEVNQVISTGGGIVLNEKAMRCLKSNGTIVFINTPLSELYQRIDDTRPLVKSREDLDNLYNNRIALYKKYADVEIKGNENIEYIVEKINEHLSDKWS